MTKPVAKRAITSANVGRHDHVIIHHLHAARVVSAHWKHAIACTVSHKLPVALLAPFYVLAVVADLCIMPAPDNLAVRVHPHTLTRVNALPFLDNRGCGSEDFACIGQPARRLGHPVTGGAQQRNGDVGGIIGQIFEAKLILLRVIFPSSGEAQRQFSNRALMARCRLQWLRHRLQARTAALPIRGRGLADIGHCPARDVLPCVHVGSPEFRRRIGPC